ncbi:MAG: hypothetical protein PW843_28355 [Azospirillaceae bacterium]|nr:hypothetical protein [Azospirillaceae bacterium]
MKRHKFIHDDFASSLGILAGDLLECLYNFQEFPSGYAAIIDNTEDVRLNKIISSIFYSLTPNNRDSNVILRFARERGNTRIDDDLRLTRATIASETQNISAFPDLSIFIIYLSTILAQHRFVEIFCGIGSNEERMTGHIISEIFSSIEYVSRETISNMELLSKKRKYSGTWRKEINNYISFLKNSVQFAYADIANHKQEKDTGGDFGIIFVFPGNNGEMAYIPLRLQAKKANKSGVSDISPKRRKKDYQLSRLEESGCGYYIYYFEGEANFKPIIPLIQSCIDVRKQYVDDGKSTFRVNTFIGSQDLASFFLDILSFETELIRKNSMAEAIGILKGKNYDPPNFLIAITASAPPTYQVRVDLRRALPENRHLKEENRTVRRKNLNHNPLD